MNQYEKIMNPETGRHVSIFGKKGLSILNMYINSYQNGGAYTKLMGNPKKVKRDWGVSKSLFRVLFLFATMLNDIGFGKTILGKSNWGNSMGDKIRFVRDAFKTDISGKEVGEGSEVVVLTMSEYNPIKI